MNGRGFRFGDWQVDVGGNALSHGDARATLEPRAMDVLRYLCRHPGAVIPAEELLQKCWGTAELGDNPVHKAIAQLRRALGDSSTEPRYIETVRKRGYRAIAPVVEAADHAETWHGGSPFRGLEAFQESHAAIFFGRVQATHRLREVVLAQAAGGCPMALVLGPSGSGKTSLVRAGLLPALAEAGPVAVTSTLHMDCADLGGSDLFGALAAVLLDAERDGKPCFDGSSADTLGRRLREAPADVAARLGAGAPIRTAVFIDRLEAIFRAPATSDGDRACFVAVLEQLARAGVLVVLACRNDFYPALIALPELMALKSRGGHFDVEPPGGAEIAQMVRQPARAAQLTFEHDAATGASLDDVLCDAARASPDALPLLQYCLDELYRQRGDDGTLRFDVFRQLGGIEGALGVRAEQVVAKLPAQQQAALPHVLSLLINIGDEQSAVTARRTPWAALDSEAKRELVRALVEARLFVSELTVDVPTFGVAHEALLRRWPRVVEWIERHRQALQIRTRVAAQAERWAAAGRPRDLLLPEGTQANQARGLLEIADLALSSQEKDYVDASLRRARLGSRIRFAAMAIIGLLAVLAAVLGLTARSAQQEAEQRRADAESLMSFMLGDFVDKLRPLGRLDLLDDVSGRALKYLATANAGSSDQLSMQRAKTLKLIGEVNVGRGNEQAALQAFESAERLLNGQLARKPTDKQLLMESGALAYWLGQIRFNRGEWASAAAYMSLYRDFGQRLMALDPADPAVWLELSYAHNNLGSVALRRGHYADALKAFAQSVDLKKKIFQREPTKIGSAVDLANGLSWLAAANEKVGNLNAAMLLYQKEEELLARAHRATPSNGNWAQRLAFSFWHQGELMQLQGNNDASRQFQRAEKLLQELVQQDPTNKNWQQSLFSVRIKALLLPSPPTPEKIAHAKLLVEKLGDLSQTQPKRLDLRHLAAKSHAVVAQLALDAREQSLAAEFIARAVNMFQAIASNAGADPSVRVGFAQTLLLKAAIDEQAGNSDWRRSCRDAQALLAAIPGGDPAQLAQMAQAALCLGQSKIATPIIDTLSRAGYREARYIEYLQRHKP